MLKFPFYNWLSCLALFYIVCSLTFGSNLTLHYLDNIKCIRNSTEKLAIISITLFFSVSFYCHFSNTFLFLCSSVNGVFLWVIACCRILCKFTFLPFLFICELVAFGHVFTLADDGLLKFSTRNSSCVFFYFLFYGDSDKVLVFIFALYI